MHIGNAVVSSARVQLEPESSKCLLNIVADLKITDFCIR